MMTHDLLGSGVALVAGNLLVGTFAINIYSLRRFFMGQKNVILVFSGIVELDYFK